MGVSMGTLGVINGILGVGGESPIGGGSLTGVHAPAQGVRVECVDVLIEGTAQQLLGGVTSNLPNAKRPPVRWGAMGGHGGGV